MTALRSDSITQAQRSGLCRSLALDLVESPVFTGTLAREANSLSDEDKRLIKQIIQDLKEKSTMKGTLAALDAADTLNNWVARFEAQRTKPGEPIRAFRAHTPAGSFDVCSCCESELDAGYCHGCKKRVGE